jgi:hypothetical protein
MLLLTFKIAWSVGLTHWSVVLWRARKPNWLALSRPLSSVCLWTIFRNIFSNSLPVVDKRLIGRKFWGNFESLPGFDNVITSASFQGFGKQDSRRQWLNKCIRCISDLSGRCPRHSFGISSCPQAFRKFNEFAKIMYVTRSYFPQRGDVYRCEQNLDCSLNLSLMVFVTQVMRCELVF